MSRNLGWKNHRAWLPEGLEPRSLPAGAAAGMIDVLRDLGPVSGSAAVSGVEATALIPAGTSVTFRFAPEVAGQYTLLVRHTGDGLGLAAKGLSGFSPINPGPAGPFTSVKLTLDAKAQEVTASATGSQPVFVDWELLLNSGVGQSAAASTSLSGPSILAPLPSSSSAPISASSASLSGPSAVASHSSASASAPASASATASAAFLVTVPVGRPTLEPVVLGDPPGPLGPTPTAEREMIPEVAGATVLEPAMLAPGSGIGRDELALVELPWWDRLSRSIGPDRDPGPRDLSSPGEVGITQADPDLADSGTGTQQASLMGTRPAIIVGAVIAGIASRKFLAGSRKRQDRRSTHSIVANWQPVSAGWRV